MTRCRSLRQRFSGQLGQSGKIFLFLYIRRFTEIEGKEFIRIEDGNGVNVALLNQGFRKMLSVSCGQRYA